MANKLAVVMSGAVSLGSYHAGVLTELLYALDFYRKNGGPEYELDIITGASAGAITGAVVGYVTMQQCQRTDLLHKAWVELADIQKFLVQSPTNAFLSRKGVEDIARNCIQPPYDDPSPASFAPQTLRMTFTISNLNGLPRIISDTANSTFTSRFFDDAKTFHLVDDPTLPAFDPARADFRRSIRDAQTWEDVMAFGITSGAFPLAFPPAELQRFPWELRDVILTDPASFPYVDGGAFNNQPIGEAVRLSREAEGDVPDRGARKYLFVSASNSNVEFKTTISGQSEMIDIARRLATCVYGESRVSDYLRAQLINFQTTNRQKLFEKIRDMVKDNTIAAADQFKTQLETLATDLIIERSAIPGGRLGLPLEARLVRTQQQYAELLLPGEESRNRVLALLFLCLDVIADLDARTPIDIRIVAPKAGELAGESLADFAGFFRQDWREFNFRQGRRKGHEIFSQMFSNYEKEKDPATGKESQQYTILPEWAKFPQQTMKDTSPQLREKVRDLACDRLIHMIESSLDLGVVGDFALRIALKRIIGRYLERQLELR